VAFPIAVLVSGRGTNLQSLLDHAGDRLRARIAVVVSNTPGAPALARAAAAGVPTAVVDHRGYRDRVAFEDALIAALDAHRPRLVVLAGFMRVLTPRFVGHYEGRLINIHPSLLPCFPGLDTHARALAAGVERHGATVHFVTAGVDEGPIVLQVTVPVLAADTPEALAARVLEQEHRILPQAVRWFAEGRLRCEAGGARLDGRPAHEVARLEDF